MKILCKIDYIYVHIKKKANGLKKKAPTYPPIFRIRIKLSLGMQF